MKPITRIDMYLAVISGDEDAVTPLPEPITRIDMYLASLAGMDVAELPEPITRIDYYLAALCGMNVVIPDEPVTRIDFYLAALNGQTVDTPEAITRIDHYLDAWAGGGSLPWATFTGNPLQFNAPKAHTLRSAVVAFSPIQSGSGDPSPDNVRPISGWTGVDIYGAGENLWDEEWEVGSIYPSNGSPRVDNNAIRSINPFPIKAGATYYGKIGASGVQLYIAYWNEDGYLSGGYRIDNMAFTVPVGATKAKIWTYLGVYNVYQHDISINYPSTDTEYHPTKGISTSTLSFPSTVYGGNAEVAEDGTATGSGTWAKYVFSENDEWQTSSTPNRFFIYLRNLSPSAKAQPMVTDQPQNIISSIFGQGIYKNADGVCYLVSTVANRQFVVNTTVASTVEEIKDLFAGTDLAYEIETPVPFTVTASSTPTAVQGINTMWTDGDNLTVEARAEAVNLSALQSLNMLLGGRYVNNHTEEDLTDEEALDVILGGQR